MTTKCKKYYYAEYRPYGVGTRSEDDILRAFKTRKGLGAYLTRHEKWAQEVKYPEVCERYTAKEINDARGIAKRSNPDNLIIEAIRWAKSEKITRANTAISYEALVQGLIDDGYIIDVEITDGNGVPGEVYAKVDDNGSLHRHIIFMEGCKQW